MDKIRILHVVSKMDRGGLETLIMNIYRNINREKIQFDFLTHREGIGSYDSEIIKLGGKIYSIPYVNDVGPIRYPKQLYKFFIEHNNYKIVHSHMNCVSGIILREAKRAGIKVCIAHSHSTGNTKGRYLSNTYKRYAQLFINKNSDFKFACSEDAGKWLFKDKYQNVNLINNGIDINEFKYNKYIRTSIRKELAVDEDTFVIGHVGRFVPVKNHTFIIDIFNNVLQKRANSRLILVGTGPLQNKIIEKVKKLEIENKVIFLGERSDVNRLLQGFDLMLFPSLYEGLPMALVEAQASGLNCVISDRITCKVDIGCNLMKYLSLDDGSKVWSKFILRIDCNMRNNININSHLNMIGYNIKETAKNMEEFYINNYYEEVNRCISL
jgi:glycosyltransferase involved in cell wall biosynthesis